MNWDYFTPIFGIQNITIIIGCLLGVYIHTYFSKDSYKEFFKDKFNIYALFISYIVCVLVINFFPAESLAASLVEG